MLAGDDQGAHKAYDRHVQASVNDPQLLAAAAELCENKLAVAERLLRGFLKENPTDVTAIRMLAETGSRLGRYAECTPGLSGYETYILVAQPRTIGLKFGQKF
jgi:hypothetical protein